MGGTRGHSALDSAIAGAQLSWIVVNTDWVIYSRICRALEVPRQRILRLL